MRALPPPPAPLWPLALSLWLGLAIGPSLQVSVIWVFVAALFVGCLALPLEAQTGAVLASLALALFGLARSASVPTAPPPLERGLFLVGTDPCGPLRSKPQWRLLQAFDEGPRATLGPPLWAGDYPVESSGLSRSHGSLNGVDGRVSTSALLWIRGRLLLPRHEDAMLRLVPRTQAPALASSRPGLADFLESYPTRIYRSLCAAAADRVRGVQAGLSRSLAWSRSSQSAALLGAWALGNRAAITPELQEVFARTGLAHVLAISGLHVASLSAGLVWLLTSGLHGVLAPFCSRFVSLGFIRPIALGLVLTIVFLYVLVAGAPVSARRAGIMVAVAGFALVLHRRVSGFNALGAAIILVLAFEPSAARSIALPLSAGSVAALLLLRRLLGPGLQFKRVGGLHIQLAARAFRGAFVLLMASAVTLVATAPVVAAVFGRVPIAGLWTNVVLLPPLVVLLPLSISMLVLGATFPIVAPICVGGQSFLLDLWIEAARWLAQPERCPIWLVTVPRREAQACGLVSLILLIALSLGWRRPLPFFAVSDSSKN